MDNHRERISKLLGTRNWRALCLY